MIFLDFIGGKIGYIVTHVLFLLFYLLRKNIASLLWENYVVCWLLDDGDYNDNDNDNNDD